ncbi:MAG: cell division protein ZapA [Bacteroidaceae bacterium]|nr:cell division protein ZapA [Bacteroidaceae bacterium]MBR3716633.1 cell division protein ZapA [Bacteroidaceae bacterium]
MDDKIRINLQMADTTLPLTIRREEEETVRKAAKQVDNLLNAYRDRYKSNITERTALVMVAYQLALSNLQKEVRNDTEPYTTKIKELTNLLEEYISKE